MQRLTHLQRLEAESIQIFREAVSESEKPVMLYSVGKDSAVMLHLAAKAFFPSVPPFPLLHVDTTWKFRAMYEFRDEMAASLGMELLVSIRTRSASRRESTRSITARRCTRTCGRPTDLKQALDQVRLRSRLRWRSSRRGEVTGQGAGVLDPLGAASLGPEAATPGVVALVQRAGAAGGERFECSRCRTGPSSTCGSTSTWSRFRSCRCTSRHRAPGGGAGWDVDHGG